LYRKESIDDAETILSDCHCIGYLDSTGIARAYQTGASDSAIPRCSKVCVLGVAVCDARPRVAPFPRWNAKPIISSKTIDERAALGSAHRGASRQHRRPTFLGVTVCDAARAYQTGAESSTIIFFVGIRYSMRDLLYDLSNYA